MWLSMFSRGTNRFASTAIVVTCYVIAVGESADSLVPSFLEGITSVASNAANLLVHVVEKPKNILFNATKMTTDYIDSAASRGLEFKLRRLLEKFRTRMPQGIPDLGIPPLEPLKLKEAKIETKNPEIGIIFLYMENVSINRLSTFIVDRARLSLIGPMIAVNISVPIVHANGFYKISGNVGNKYPVHGDGPFEALVYNFRIYVNTILGYSGGMYMKSFELDFSFESIDLALNNFMGGQETGRIMTEVFQDVATEALEIIKPEILPKIQDYIASQANDTMYHLTMKDVLNIILGEVEARDFLFVP